MMKFSIIFALFVIMWNCAESANVNKEKYMSQFWSMLSYRDQCFITCLSAKVKYKCANQCLRLYG
ncbi:hypothetical protein A3Q56_03783 [Intoshia linei]|uniref:Uncharacterized protein n=1 Tax=Intoshia linei TaxID=1819745 RepID=A0A177B2L4_9BILA|nr:hypothetical protein A3Q56_03783 [Intoshia linei]